MIKLSLLDLIEKWSIKFLGPEGGLLERGRLIDRVLEGASSKDFLEISPQTPIFQQLVYPAYVPPIHFNCQRACPG